MLYRFNLEVSDIDRGVYETLNFRVAQHPSETAPYLLSRVLAYALSYQEGLEFTPGGLADPDSPALWARPDPHSIDLWIEIGNPSARKLHKAGKLSKRVIVYTYKSADVLIEDIKGNDVHRAEDIQIIAFEFSFLQTLELLLEKNNRWSLLRQQGRLDIDKGDRSVSTEMRYHSLKT